VAQILKAPLVRSSLGIYSMRDVLIARGEIPVPAEVHQSDLASVEAAFVDCDLETLRQLVETVQQGYKDAVGLEDSITDKVGSSKAVSMAALSDVMKSIHEYLARQLRVRESELSSGQAAEDAEFAAGPKGGAAPVGTSSAPAISGEIRSREDVLRTLDKICEYYERCEPSSPLPMLLKRAKRLATKSFLDILEDLTPEGVSQARLIGGLEKDTAEE
jgi:type VI secretion system protein ImpA